VPIYSKIFNKVQLKLIDVYSTVYTVYGNKDGMECRFTMQTTSRRGRKCSSGRCCMPKNVEPLNLKVLAAKPRNSHRGPESGLFVLLGFLVFIFTVR
jgi:hypothetical protein